MKAVVLTKHAQSRMQQRGLGPKDIQLIEDLGTPIEDGYLLTATDVCREISNRKGEIADLQRLRATMVVIEGNRLLTAYRANRRKQHAKLRRVRQRHIPKKRPG